jgi:CHAT domain-containing protein
VHFATHGFFADSSFRSAFQLDERMYERNFHDRASPGSRSPLVLSGLVLAGANKPDLVGDGGILTAEAIVGLRLEGLDLAVLSACETGLGEVAGGEGVYGLQRAFHLAGTRDVIASLWSVGDESTSALMGVFYRNLWIERMAPLEALRQAQLTLYRASPQEISHSHVSPSPRELAAHVISLLPLVVKANALIGDA